MNRHLTPTSQQPPFGGGIALLWVLCLSLGLTPRAFGEVKTWTGAHPTSHFWNVASNWDPSGAPRNGDDLIFPDPDIALKEVNTNNIVNLRVRSLTFQGNNALYHLWGNGITLSNALNAGHTAGINTVQLDSITLGGGLEFRCTSVLIVNSDVALNGFPLILNTPAAPADLIFLNGAISGTGSLRKDGLGIVQLGGTLANTFAGLTTVRAGQLNLAKPDGIQAVPDSLVVGDGLGAGDKVLWVHDNQLGAPGNVEVKQGATLDLNNHDEGIGTLTMNGGTVDTGTGTLSLGGTVTIDNTSLVSTIQGNLHLGLLSRTFDVKPFGGSIGLQIPARVSGSGFAGAFAGMTFQGGGTVVLSGTNTFRGPVQVREGYVIAESGGAFGTVEGGVVAELEGRIGLQTANVGAEPLTLKSSGTPSEIKFSNFGNSAWGGDITLNGNQTIQSVIGVLTLSGAISGTADLTFDGGTIRLEGSDANTYVGSTRVSKGVLELNKSVNRNAIPGDLRIGGFVAITTVRYLQGFQLPSVTDVSVLFNALLDLNGFQDTIGSLQLTGGRVETGVGILRLGGDITANGSSVTAEINGNLDLNATRIVRVFSGSAAPCDLEINAVVTDGGITKQGTGTLCLNANNTFTGPVRVEEGELRMNRDKALGTPAGGTVVVDGASLYVGTGANNVDEPLTLAGAGVGGTNGALRYLGAVNWRTNIVLASASSVVSDADLSVLDIQGAISGSGRLTKAGGGRLRLSGSSANTFNGETVALDGILELAKTSGRSVPRSLVIGSTGLLVGSTTATARNFDDAQVFESITVNRGSLYDLNGRTEGILNLFLIDGADVTLGNGLLNVTGKIEASRGPLALGGGSTIGPAAGRVQFIGAPAEHVISAEEALLALPDAADLTIDAKIVGSQGIRKMGNGDLLLTANNDYDGKTVINEGDLWIANTLALGSITAGTEVNGTAALGILGDTVVFEPLTLNATASPTARTLRNLQGTNSWSGAIVLSQTARVDVQTGTSLRVYSVVSGPGGITKDGLGTLEFRGTSDNTYTGVTTVDAGKLFVARTGGSNKSIKGSLVIGDGVGGLNADVLETDGAEPQIGNLVRVQVQPSGLLRVGTTVPEAIGSLSGNGRVLLEGPRLSVTSDSSTVFSGLISGTGAFDKYGDGRLTLLGNNTYTGTTTVHEGQLRVNGSQSLSPVNVLGGGLLAGSGTVGDVDIFSGGTLNPGADIGVLTTRDLRLRAGSRFVAQISGGAGASLFDAVNVISGTVTNDGAVLLVEMVGNAAPVEGAVFNIIQNGGVDAVQGIFAGLPNGATLLANSGLKFRVNYNAFSQNDVRLTLVDVPLGASSSSLAGGNLNSVADVNECNLFTVSLFNEAAWTLSDVKAELTTPTPGVLITQSESGYPDILPSTRQSNLVPFQFSTLPGFQCGTNIQLHLKVTTPTNGTFTVPLVVHSGSPGSPLRFNRSSAVAIPDANTLDSGVNVAGFAGHLAKVAVSVHIAHNQLNNLDLILIAPDGTEVLLSSDNGGTANDYGTGCTDSERTVFDPSASRLISSGLASAPYVGTFRPEGNLDFWRGRWQTEVNGAWTLRVIDDAPGGLGSLNCWSLFLYPAECVDGGGICESCNGPFLAELKDTDSAMTQKLAVNGLPAICAADKTCPGLGAAIGTYRYDVHRFTNGLNAACVSITLTPEFDSGAAVALQSVSYLNGFDPSNPCVNYVADGGSPSIEPRTYGFKVEPGQVFEVVVQSAVSGEGSPYRLSVDGFECPPPVLTIAKTDDPNKVQLSWSTAYPQHRLEGTTEVSGGPWSGVGPAPAVIGGKFSVTNNATLDQRFFRLNQP